MRSAPLSRPPSYTSIAPLPSDPCKPSASSNPSDSVEPSTRPSNQDDAGPRRATFASAASYPAQAEPPRAPPPPAAHPRLAAQLGVGARWRAALLVCRALSTAPATWWGLRCLRMLLDELLRPSEGGRRFRRSAATTREATSTGWALPALGLRLSVPDARWDGEKRLGVTEVCLGGLWCAAAAYLCWLFSDCLLARWLHRYTPGAIVVRLLALNAMIAYVISWVLDRAGAADDPRRLLPVWIAVTTSLTGLYHATQRKINIRRETSASMGVFAVASFVSMCALLVQLHWMREG